MKIQITLIFLSLFVLTSCASIRKAQKDDVENLRKAIITKKYDKARKIVNQKFKDGGIAYLGDGMTRRSYTSGDVLKLITLHQKCFKNMNKCGDLRREGWRSYLYGAEEINFAKVIEKDIDDSYENYNKNKENELRLRMKKERDEMYAKKIKAENDRDAFLLTKEGALAESCEWQRQLTIYYESLSEQKKIEKISGVVDLKKKRSLGEGIRFRQSMLKNWSQKYKTRSRQSWRPSLCK